MASAMQVKQLCLSLREACPLGLRLEAIAGANHAGAQIA